MRVWREFPEKIRASERFLQPSHTNNYFGRHALILLLHCLQISLLLVLVSCLFPPRVCLLSLSVLSHLKLFPQPVRVFAPRAEWGCHVGPDETNAKTCILGSFKNIIGGDKFEPKSIAVQVSITHVAPFIGETLPQDLLFKSFDFNLDLLFKNRSKN